VPSWQLSVILAPAAYIASGKKQSPSDITGSINNSKIKNYLWQIAGEFEPGTFVEALFS
jgi:hypothetical protein